LPVIFNLQDLAVSLKHGLERFGYDRILDERIGIQNDNHGKIFLDVPVKDSVSPDGKYVTRFVLYRVRGASEFVDK